jgi:transposase
MARLVGWAPRGERLIGRVPHGHWKTTTFLAGLRHDRIVAPLVVNGAIDGETFRAWVEQALAPTLVPGDIVMADNLSSHKVAGVREAIEACGGTIMFLPAYSPDLNPIEQFFAKLKAALRRLAPRSGPGRVARPFGSALTDPGRRLSRTRLFPEVTRIGLLVASMDE